MDLLRRMLGGATGARVLSGSRWVANWLSDRSLVFRFTALFAFITLIIMLAAGFLLSRYLVGVVTDQASEDLARGAEVVASRVATHLSPEDLEGPLQGERYEEFSAYLEALVLPADTERIKVWNRDGMVVFSDNRDEVGNVYALKEQLREAFAGGTATELADLQGAENVDEREFGKLLEVYTPLQFPGSSDVWGAFEVYQDYSGVEALSAKMGRAINIGVGTMVAFVYLTSLWLVKQGSDTIKKRQDELLSEIDERKRAEGQIKHLAYHDSLTDLPNRALLKDRLSIALAQARRKERMVGVMFLDLDRFKFVNDTAGHAMGDRLLQVVAERLSGLLREGDTVARTGGDEFMLLLPEVSGAEQVSGVAERILEAFRRPFVLAGQELYATTSIGIVMYPVDGENAETLLSNADIAMYKAKEEGRDRFQMFTPAMNAYISKQMRLEKDLRRALERRQFVVYYQPQVNIDTGQIVGNEALVRWQHPDRGLVPPDDFIPLAEETGLIVSLGEWVLRTACAQNKAWQEAGLPRVRVAVNLSARQFGQQNLVEIVAGALRETGLAPEWLELEITEGTAMRDIDLTVRTLNSLKEMGVYISLDDFGTGHSSLAYLRRFPIDGVKIDRAFVRGTTVDADDAAIVAAIISIAENLGLRTVAEGVETEEQLAFLKELHCQELQGYLFSRPVPSDKLEELLAQRHPLEMSTGV